MPSRFLRLRGYLTGRASLGSPFDTILGAKGTIAITQGIFGQEAKMKLILALLDLSDGTSDVVRLAGRIALAMQSKLILLHVAMPNAEFVGGKEREDVSREGIAAELRRHHRELEILQLELRKMGADATALMVRSDSARGNPVGKIVD